MSCNSDVENGTEWHRNASEPAAGVSWGSSQRLVAAAVTVERSGIAVPVVGAAIQIAVARADVVVAAGAAGVAVAVEGANIAGAAVGEPGIPGEL